MDQWQGLSPLEFVERVSNSALSAMEVNGVSVPSSKYRGHELKIDTNFLADAVQPLPQPIQRLMQVPSQTSVLLSGSKRKRDNGDVSDVRNQSNVHLPSSLFWDTNFISQNDNSSQGNDASMQLAEVAWQLQRDMQLPLVYSQCFSSYARFRYDFESEFYEIVRATKSKTLSTDGARNYFDTLYHETVIKLDCIVKMVKDITSDSLDEIMNISNKYTPPHQEKKTIRRGNVNKKELADYMNIWIKENWVNPYPDDQTLNEIADKLGTEQTTISNWLINARTRRWRPAIVKAFSLNRPPNMLLDDSIDIFDGKQVKPIEQHH